MAKYVIKLNNEPTVEDPNPLEMYVKVIGADPRFTIFLVDALMFDSYEEAEEASAPYRGLWDVRVFIMNESIHPINAYRGKGKLLSKLSRFDAEKQAQLVREGTANGCIEFVRSNVDRVVDLDALGARVLKVGKGWDYGEFVSETGVDKAPFEAKILESGEGEDCARFADEVKDADVQGLQARMIALGASRWFHFFAGRVKGANVKLLESLVLQKGDPDHCALFALQVEGSDGEALSRVVAEKGCPYYCEQVAREVKDADVQALSKRMAEVGNIDDCLFFARRIPKSDRKLLLDRVLELMNRDHS